MTHVNRYYDTEFVAEHIRAGAHRDVIGGMWERIGALQFAYLRDRGLTPQMRLLDIGCGCLRGGRHFVGYLDPGRYYGIDLSQALLDAGYDIELAEAGLQHRLPRENLRQTDAFEVAPFGVAFDMALALSVFTHLPLNHLRLCLARLADTMPPGARFFATVFHCPPDRDWTAPLRHPAGKISHPDRDPFHYGRADLDYAASGLPWRLDTLQDWGHPRDQWMAAFRRTDAPDEPVSA